MNESNVLAEVNNENQTLVAVVQQDSRAAYFYIYPTEEYSERFQVRACWLRNLATAPQQEDRAAMEAGLPQCWRPSIAVIWKAKRHWIPQG